MSEPAAAASYNIKAIALKLPEFLTDNTRVWFAQTKVHFAFRGMTTSLTKFYYCVGALNRADAAQVVDLIKFPPEEEPHESLKERLTELCTLNPFQRCKALMALTLAVDKKPSTLMGKMCSLLPLDHRIHKTECFMFKGFFLNNLLPNIRTHLMREDIKDPRKLAAKANKICQSASDRSVHVVSAASPPTTVPEDAALKASGQHPPPCPASFAAPCPAPSATRPPATSSSQNFDHCWYYRNHGDQAQRCRSPCSWIPEN